MKKQNKTINWELAKEDPKAFMTELANIDNQGEMNVETLTEINGGRPIDSPIFTPPIFGIIYNDPTKDTILY